MWSQTYIAATAAALIGLLGCRPAGVTEVTPARDAPVVPASEPGGRPDVELRDVDFARLAEGRVTASGRVAAVQFWRGGQRFFGREARLRLPPPVGSFASLGALSVEAPRLSGELDARNAVASGGLRVQAARGDDLRVERAAWSGSESLVWSDAPVQVRGPGYTLDGSGFQAAPDGRWLRIRKAHGQLAGEPR